MTSGQDDALLARFDALERRLGDAGKPVTPQRREVLRALCARKDHPSADEVHADVARRMPGLSRATVYRSLDHLVSLGLASRVGHTGVAVRFDPRTDHHHHFECETCGAITDVEPDGRDELHLPRGFAVRSSSILFRGECPDCRERASVSRALH